MIYFTERYSNLESKVTLEKDIAVAEQATFYKNGRNNFCTTVHKASADRTLLSPDKSAFKMIIPKLSESETFVGCIHTNAMPFSEVIPENECMVAPIIDIHKSTDVRSAKSSSKYLLRIPHCLDFDKDVVGLDQLPVVRHGDIYTNKPFTIVPYRQNHTDDLEIYYDIDPMYINIYTSTFSQFICTHCKKKCTEDLVVLVSGGFKMFEEINVEVLPFVCNRLHTILDYKQVKQPRKCIQIVFRNIC